MIMASGLESSQNTDNSNDRILEEQSFTPHPRRAMASLWIFMVLFGVTGNGCVIYIFTKFKNMRTVTNRYIVNLAITDVTFLVFCVPLTIFYYLNQNWPFGDAVCKASIYMAYVTLQATCLTLAAMTIDRYYAICHPFASLRHRRPIVAILVSVGVWALSFPLSTPYLLYSEIMEIPDGSVACLENWNKTGNAFWIGGSVTIYTVIISYALPLLVIFVCYGKILNALWTRRNATKAESLRVFKRIKNRMNLERSSSAGDKISEAESKDSLEIEKCSRPNDIRFVSLSGISTTTDLHKRQRIKVTKMVGLVIGLFMVCWAPAHSMNLWMKLDPNFPRTSAVYYLKMTFHTISYLNSILNPLIYAFMGDNFRKHFIRVLCQCRGDTTNKTGTARWWRRNEDDGRWSERRQPSRTITTSIRYVATNAVSQK